MQGRGNILDVEALWQWEPVLGFYFESMEKGFAELRRMLVGARSGDRPRGGLREALVRAHAMRGASSLVGFSATASLLGELEGDLTQAMQNGQDAEGDRWEQTLLRAEKTYRLGKEKALQLKRKNHEQTEDTGGR